MRQLRFCSRSFTRKLVCVCVGVRVYLCVFLVPLVGPFSGVRLEFPRPSAALPELQDDRDGDGQLVEQIAQRTTKTVAEEAASRVAFFCAFECPSFHTAQPHIDRGRLVNVVVSRFS